MNDPGPVAPRIIPDSFHTFLLAGVRICDPDHRSQADMRLPDPLLLRIKAGLKAMRVDADLRKLAHLYRARKNETALTSGTFWSMAVSVLVFPIRTTLFQGVLRRIGPLATSAEVVPGFMVPKRQTTWWKGLG